MGSIDLRTLPESDRKALSLAANLTPLNGQTASDIADLFEEDYDMRRTASNGLTLVQSIKQTLLDGDTHVSQRETPHVFAGEALQCSRKIWYRLRSGKEERSSYSLTSLLAFAVGNAIHTVIQDALAAMHPGFEREVVWDMVEITGRGDGIYKTPIGKTVVEIKTMNSMSFDKAAKTNMPNAEHVVQAALTAVAVDADNVHLIYASKQARQDQMPILEFVMPNPKPIALNEITRMKAILHDALNDVLVPRAYVGEVIADPKRQKWPCTYCPFIERCVADGPGGMSHG